VKSTDRGGRERERERVDNMTRRAVVVSGLGLVTPLGKTVQATWQRLLNSESGVSIWGEGLEGEAPLAAARCSGVTSEDIKRVTSSNPRAQEARFIALALLAGEEALRDSGLSSKDFDALDRNVAVVIGCGMGAATSEIPQVQNQLATASSRRVSPFFVPRLLPNMAAGNVSIVNNFRGPILSPATACASGGHAILDAARLIERGEVEVAVCGGTESALDKIAAVGFSRLKALSSSTSSSASKPFDAGRDGFVMGEGAGILILESEEHFARRVAGSSSKVPYARFAGGGMSGDAFHITSPSPDGIGAELCMRRSLKDASIKDVNTVGYVNAHATSTPVGDQIEADAIGRVFEKRKEPVKVSSTKGATGHLLGAAGAVEAAFTVLSLHYGMIPPSLNIQQIDPQIRQDRVHVVANRAIECKDMRFAMSNSFGFGGTNVSLVFERC